MGNIGTGKLMNIGTGTIGTENRMYWETLQVDIRTVNAVTSETHLWNMWTLNTSREQRDWETFLGNMGTKKI